MPVSNKKSIILILPEDFGLSELISRNFSYHGFDVICYRRQPYNYKNPIERFNNFFRKTFLGDKSYKENQQDKEALEILKNNIMQRELKIDYALFIRPDKLSPNSISIIKNYAKKSIGYQWDGLDRYPDIFDRIELFDDFYVFDPKDVHNHTEYNLKPITNFYFDMEKKLISKENNKKTMYFIGSHIPQRVSTINQFIRFSEKLNLDINFLIRLDKKNKEKNTLYYNNCIKFISEDIEYIDNLKNVENSDVLIDFINNVHSGLSFRVFESIFYQKKLITNNIEVSKYDLYHEDNIYIWDNEEINIDSLRDFLNRPYYILPSEVLNKYSFKTWYSSILSIN